MKKVTVQHIANRSTKIVGVSIEMLDAKDLLLLSLGKCAAITAAALMNKMKVQASLTVESSGTLTEPAEMAYSTFVSFHQIYRVECSLQQREKARHAIELTHEKYCGVGLMLSKAAPISMEIVFE